MALKPVRIESGKDKIQEATTLELLPGEAIDIGSHYLLCNEPGKIISLPKNSYGTSASKEAREFGYEVKYPRLKPGTKIIIEVS